MKKEKPSRTARKVALNLVTLGTMQGMQAVLPSGIAASTAKLLIESGAASRQTIHFSRTRTAVGLYLAFDWMMPGQFRAFGYRKAFVEHQVRKGIDAGARQVLVLGAGYDTLGWRLAPAFSAVNFFEIDRPETMRLKAKGIEAMGTRTNLYCLAENLGKRDLVDSLNSDARWDSAAPTVIVAEGLLMYLHPEAVKRLLEQCTAVTGANSRIVFSYVGRHATGWPDAGPWTWLVLWMLRVSGEPWLWSIADEKIGPFLEKCHWTLAQEPAGAAQGAGVERFCVAVK